MMRRLLVENWGMKLLSLVLAVLLYVFVRSGRRETRPPVPRARAGLAR